MFRKGLRKRVVLVVLKDSFTPSASSRVFSNFESRLITIVTRVFSNFEFGLTTIVTVTTVVARALE